MHAWVAFLATACRLHYSRVGRVSRCLVAQAAQCVDLFVDGCFCSMVIFRLLRRPMALACLATVLLAAFSGAGEAARNEPLFFIPWAHLERYLGA